MVQAAKSKRKVVRRRPSLSVMMPPASVEHIWVTCPMVSRIPICRSVTPKRYMYMVAKGEKRL